MGVGMGEPRRPQPDTKNYRQLTNVKREEKQSPPG